MRHLDSDLRLLTVATLLFALGVGMYLQLLPVYALRLGSSPFGVGMLMATMLAATAAGSIPGAWAARRFRLKPVIVFAWWLRVLAGLLFFIAPSWPWLIPALIVSGLYMANNPAYKAYIYLKSEPQRVASNLTLIFGAYPLGLVVSPLVGGHLAARIGMRFVFLVATGVMFLSALTVTFIKDTPYHTAETRFDVATLLGNRRFTRYVGFFLVAFLAAYIGQPFLNPFLEQVHHQGYAALGVYSSLAALGTALLTRAMGRVTDVYGPRAGAGGVLVFMCLGSALLLAGGNPVLWGAAMLCCGAFDAVRFVATGIVGDSFEGIPLAWGYAIFDTLMGVPMAGGAVLGGVLFRSSATLPSAVVIGIAGGLLAILTVGGLKRITRPATVAE